MPKKTARRAYSKNLLDGSRPNVEASEDDHVVVSSVVVLSALVVIWMRTQGAYSFAKTPLKAAQAPDVMAKKSQADLVGVDIAGGECVCCYCSVELVT